MKYNYPIKYAVMPIIEQSGWINGIHESIKDYSVVAYIVSKCYLVSEKKKYNANGIEELEYEVVFPYVNNNVGYINDWKRNCPETNFNGDVYNSNNVTKVFDTFEEAKKIANINNHEILQKKLFLLPTDVKEIERLKVLFNEKLDDYECLENYIETNTSEMIVNNPVKTQRLILMLEDKDKLVDISLYEFIKIYRCSKFIICHVSESDFKAMTKQIKDTGILDERVPRVMDNECNYDRFDYLLANDLKNNCIRVIDSKNSKLRGNYYLDDDFNLIFDRDLYRFDKEPVSLNSIGGIKVYTTESYDDVITSYKGVNNISLSQTKVLKRIKGE